MSGFLQNKKIKCMSIIPKIENCIPEVIILTIDDLHNGNTTHHNTVKRKFIYNISNFFYSMLGLHLCTFF